MADETGSKMKTKISPIPWLILGLVFGAIVGVFMGNLIVSIIIGVVAGAIIGFGLSAIYKR